MTDSLLSDCFLSRIDVTWSIRITGAAICWGAYGKPIGITLACMLAVELGLCRLPLDMQWRHVLGAGMPGGIGFTVSIFITNLALTGDPATINASKVAVLIASLGAGMAGFAWLKTFGKPVPGDVNMETLDFQDG